MGVRDQGIGCVHKCLLAVLAEKALFSILMPIFYNMAAATIRAVWPIGGVLVYRNNAEYKANDLVQVKFI